MYPTASYDPRAPGRSRQRRAQSDPGQPYVTLPYRVQRPAPARQTGEHTGTLTAGVPNPQSSVRNFSVEDTADSFVHRTGSLLPGHPPNSLNRTNPPAPVSTRPTFPRRASHQRSSSRQGSFRAPQGPGALTRDAPQPPRSLLNVSSWNEVREQGDSAQSQDLPTSTLSHSMDVHRQGSYYQPPSTDGYRGTSATHRLHHHSTRHRPRPSTTHHVVHPRPLHRLPSAASHQYALNITQPVHGYASSAASNVSTSLDNSVPHQRNHDATSLPPGTAASYYAGTVAIHTHSGSLQRSRSHARVPSSSMPGTIAMPESAHRLEKPPPPLPSPKRRLAADEIYRSTHRPALPANYDSQIETRYVNMLLALDDISPFFNVLSMFFTWILLAGFVLLPGTFASWKDAPAGSAEGYILRIVHHLSLYVIAFLCTGIGACGMIWLWWRWQGNYIWITNRVFIPGFLNSIAGVISTLSSIYGAQDGTYGRTEKTVVIVTSALSLICGTLALVYEFVLIRNLKLEHDRKVGIELPGEYGEGVLGEPRGDQNEGA